ncbi:reverse transcriptase [Phytophthora megakarya]|uniref:Reverse transcriptase n=1 Tax=Phytophthora megakarya TaxID=4795 RepID=A0A225WFA8_9STRA|nr:reverse transcriptase [Phytophthora megakarya]
MISNIGEEILQLDHRLDVGMILDQAKVPRSPGFLSVGSRRYREWQNLALASTVDTRSEPPEHMKGPAEPEDQRPTYPTPRSILRRSETAVIDIYRTLISTLETRSRTGIDNAAQIEAGFPSPEGGHPFTPPENPNADRYRSGYAGGGGISESMPDQVIDRTGTKDIKPTTEYQTGTKDIEPKTGNPNCQARIKLESGEAFDVKSPIHPTEGVELQDPSAEGAAATAPQDAEDDDEIYYHESGDLSAEDREGNLSVLPEIPISTTAKVSIVDLQEIEKLRQIIWKNQHRLIDTPYLGRPGASCVTSMSETRNRSRYDPGKYQRLIKGLLAAENIRPSTSPWALLIVIVCKSNGVDISLCIDYKLVNSITRMMVYPTPLISNLLEDLDKALWYCSLDTASGF